MGLVEALVERQGRSHPGVVGLNQEINALKQGNWVLDEKVVRPASLFPGGIEVSLDKLLDYHTWTTQYRGEEPNPTAAMLGRIINPVMTCLFAACETESFGLRSSTIADVTESTLSPSPSKRSWLKYVLTYDHHFEKFPWGSYADCVKQKLMKGPDLDLTHNGKDYFAIAKKLQMMLPPLFAAVPRTKFASTIQLREIPSAQDEVSQSLTAIWQVDEEEIYYLTRYPRNTYFKHPLFQNVYLRLSMRTTRSGVPIIELDVCTPPSMERLEQSDVHEVSSSLDVVFSIGMTGDQNPNDARSSKAVNLWDRQARGSLQKRDQAFSLYVPPESINTIASPIKKGEAIENLRQNNPLAFFEESVRITRKALENNRLLAMTPTGRKHLVDEKTSTMCAGVEPETAEYFRRVLQDSKFRSSFFEALGNLDDAKRKHWVSTLAAEFMTEFFYAPRETMTAIDTMGHRDYLPNAAKFSDSEWDEMTLALPNRREHEMGILIRMNAASILFNKIRPNISNTENAWWGDFYYKALLVQHESVYHRFERVLREIKNKPAKKHEHKLLEAIKHELFVYSPPYGFKTMAEFFCVDPSVM